MIINDSELTTAITLRDLSTFATFSPTTTTPPFSTSHVGRPTTQKGPNSYAEKGRSMGNVVLVEVLTR